MGGNVVREHLDAIFGVEVDDIGAVLAQPIDAAAKVHGLADHYGADAKLANQAAAVPAGRQGSNHDFVAVAPLAPCLSKGICFSMAMYFSRFLSKSAPIFSRSCFSAPSFSFGDDGNREQPA